MPDWLVALILLLVLGTCLPFAIRRSSRATRRGSGSGVAMALFMAFSNVLDPAKNAQIENVGKRDDRKDAAEGDGDKC